MERTEDVQALQTIEPTLSHPSGGTDFGTNPPQPPLCLAHSHTLDHTAANSTANVSLWPVISTDDGGHSI